MNLVDDLISTYRAPSPKMVEQMQMMVRKIPERFHEEIYQAIIEEEGPNILIGVNHIVSACERIGAPYTKAHYIPTEDWVCDACGNEFKYHPAPSDDDKIDKSIHDLCPKCGFQVIWTLDKRRCAELKIATEWYDRLIANHQGEDRNASKRSHQGPEFWSRHAAERERAKERRENVETKLGELDRAKRWDEERE